MQTDCYADAVGEWIRGPVSELAAVNPRYPMRKGREYPFVEMASVGENFTGILRFDSRALEGSGLSRFAAGDTLFAKITPCPQNGKVAFVASLPDQVGLGSTEFIVLSPRSRTSGRFLYHLVCSHAVRGRAVSRMEGSTGRLRVPEEVFTRRLLVPLPHPDEQTAIARILDAADTALGSTRAAVERARQLKKAVLDRFLFGALGETAYANRPRRELPDGWRLVATDALLAEEPKNGVSPEASSQPPGIPTFSIGAIRDGRVDLTNRDNLKYVRITDESAHRYRVERGDVLIVRGNANPDLVGKAGTVQDFPAGCIYPDIAKRVVFRSDGWPRVLPKFAALVWNHATVHNQVLQRAKTSNGTLKINNRDVKQIMLPVPPETEQKQLIEVMAALDAVLETRGKVAAAQQELRKSLQYDLLTGRIRVRDEGKVVA
jgi:type I restriction enzyme, S subunit